MADASFKTTEQPARTIRACVACCQRNLGAILRYCAQCVIASEKLYPAEGEILFDNFERINMPSNDASHSFEQVSARITTFYVASNLRLATLSPDGSWKKTAQKKWPIFCNLLVKHQRVPHSIGRCEEILAGCNGSGVVLTARQLELYGGSHCRAFLRG